MLREKAEKDESPVVRLYLAAALQRIPLQDRWAIAQALVQQGVDADDPNIPLMIWFGIEPLVQEDPMRFGQLTRNSSIPLISNHIARRMVDEGQLDPLLTTIELAEHKVPLLEGFLAGLEGKSDIEEPSRWATLHQQLKTDPILAPFLTRIAQEFTGAAAAASMIQTLQNNQSKVAAKLAAIKGLAKRQQPDLVPLIPGLLEESELRIEAIRSVAAFENKELSALLIKQYPNFNFSEKQEVLQTLSARASSGWQLATAIQKETIPKKEIPAYIALQLKRVVGNGFVEIWGPIDEITSDKQTAFSKYQRLCNESALAEANPGNGRLVFQKTCQACHQMYGEGGQLGPDLTGSNRANLNYLLSNILDPSGEIQDDYKLVVITTQDGRNYSGNIIAENQRQVTLRLVGQEAVQINQSDIQSREVTPNSIMPEGLLNLLTNQEVLDLVAYMRTVEQVGQTLE